MTPRAMKTHIQISYNKGTMKTDIQISYNKGKPEGRRCVQGL